MDKKNELVNYFSTRRSVPGEFLLEPGPSKIELDKIIAIGLRVPDHGKLNPWRLIIIEGENRVLAGEKLAQITLSNNPDFDEFSLKVERERFLPAPVTIGVLSSPKEHKKIPEFEQLISAGAVALNLVHGANALGYGAHWVTRWFTYDQEAAKMLGAQEGEKFVAFIHIGTAAKRLEDKPKPDVEKLVTCWKP